MPKKARRKKGGGDTGEDGVVDAGDVDVVSSAICLRVRIPIDMGIRAFVRNCTTKLPRLGMVRQSIFCDSVECVSEVPASRQHRCWREFSMPIRSGREVGTTCGRS